jgi:hypothetical protein
LKVKKAHAGIMTGAAGQTTRAWGMDTHACTRCVPRARTSSKSPSESPCVARGGRKGRRVSQNAPGSAISSQKKARETSQKSESRRESWSVHNPPTVEITRGGRGRALTCCRGGREWRDARGRAPTRRLAPRCMLLRARGGATSVSAEAEGEGPRAKKQRRVTRVEKTREDYDDVNVPPCDATRYPRRSSREMPGKSRRASRDVRVTRGKKPRVSTGASGAVRRGARAAGKRVTGLFFSRLVWSTHLCSASPPR